jgi:lambda repressor-like predicted transcriptional regulator
VAGQLSGAAAEEIAILGMVAERVARGESLRSIAKRSGIWRGLIRRLAAVAWVRYPRRWHQNQSLGPALRRVYVDQEAIAEVAGESIDWPRVEVHTRIHQLRQERLREDLGIARMLAARATEGESLDSIARTSGISRIELRSIASAIDIHYPKRRRPDETIQQAVSAVVDEGLTIRQAAEVFDWPRSCVHRFVMRERERRMDDEGLIAFHGRNAYSPRSTEDHTWRCPRHGRVTVRPCVACMAEESVQRRTTNEQRRTLSTARDFG